MLIQGNIYVRLQGAEGPAGPMMCSHSISGLYLFALMQRIHDAPHILQQYLQCDDVKLCTALNIPLEYNHSLVG